MTDTYRSCLEFLYGRLNYERQTMPRVPSELRLARMRRLLRRLGDPHEGPRIVHVAGTKGKGSTSAMIAAALSAAGLKTGLFCSPHLHALEERFSIDGRAATPDQLVSLTEAVRGLVLDLDAESPGDQRGPTFFELTTAMGLLHFARAGADAVVLEVGLGGRLDSTNAVRPAVAVVTNISLDHTRQLGSTLGAIAREKAGIFKRGRPAVSGEAEPEPARVIEAVARQRRCPFRQLGVDFEVAYTPPSQPIVRPEAGRATIRTWSRDWGTLDLPILGPHQAHNAAVALAALDVLREQGIEVGPEEVRRGFSSLRWPARVELLEEAPWVVIDGAHNPASAEALARTLRTCFPPAPTTLVFGTTRDKDMKGQLRALLSSASRVIATRYLENPRAVEPAEVARAVEALGGPPVEVTHSPEEALELARRRTPRDGLICVTGSLFLAAETRSLLLGLSTRSAGIRATPTT